LGRRTTEKLSVDTPKKLIVKYLYLYLWLIIAFLFRWLNYVFAPVERLVAKLFRLSDHARNKRKETFNNSFLSFPGGMIDWAAYGLLLGFINITIIIAVVYGEIKTSVFESGLWFGLVFSIIAVVVYYIVYFRSIKWLEDEINKAKKNCLQ
jgi:hypothetical protein